MDPTALSRSFFLIRARWREAIVNNISSAPANQRGAYRAFCLLAAAVVASLESRTRTEPIGSERIHPPNTKPEHDCKQLDVLRVDGCIAQQQNQQVKERDLVPIAISIPIPIPILVTIPIPIWIWIQTQTRSRHTIPPPAARNIVGARNELTQVNEINRAVRLAAWRHCVAVVLPPTQRMRVCVCVWRMWRM